MQRNAEISAICLKRKGSSQLFSSLFRNDMCFLSFKNISRQSIWNLACQQNFFCVLKWFSCYFSNRQTDDVATQGCGWNSVEDVEFSKNISENQSNSSQLFFISPFIEFIQFSIHSMCDCRMWTLKFIVRSRNF